MDDLKQGGKNSRITAGGGKFLRIFAVKSFRNTLFLVVKTQKHTQKVLKFSPPAVERRKNTLLWFEYTPNRVKYRISAPRRRRKIFEFLPPVEFLPPPLWVDDLQQGGGKNSRISVDEYKHFFLNAPFRVLNAQNRVRC